MHLFKNRNFCLLFSATALSNLASKIFNFVMSWYILERTGSALQMGTYVSLPYLVHIFFSSFIGVICDRLDRKKIVVYTDLANVGLMLLALSSFYFTDAFFLIAVYLVNMLICFADSFASIGTFTLKKECCDEKDLTRCNSFFTLESLTNSIIGAAISGFLYQYLGLVVCMTGIVVAYVISVCLESRLQISMSYVSKEKLQVREIIQNMKEGVRYVSRRQDIMRIFLCAIIFNVTINPLCSVILPYLIHHFELGVTRLSLLNASMTVGSIFCSAYLVKKNHVSLEKFGQFFLLYLVCFILLMLDYQLFFSGYVSFWLFLGILMVTMFGVGIMSPLFNIPFNAHLQATVDDQMMGRVYAYFNVVSHSLTPAALMVSGLLSEWNLLGLCMLLTILIVIGLVLNRKA